jgi:hypothetical protein
MWMSISVIVTNIYFFKIDMDNNQSVSGVRGEMGNEGA